VNTGKQNRPELRSELRIVIAKKGRIAKGDAWAPCLIQDVSRSGFQILCNSAYPQRELLQLSCELYPQQIMRCKVEVRYVIDTCHGTRLVEMDELSARLSSRFIDEVYASQYFRH
jgi:hypothetical protein